MKCTSAVNYPKDLEEMLKSFKLKKRKYMVYVSKRSSWQQLREGELGQER